MTASAPSASSATLTTRWTPPVIRQVALIMLALCVTVPAALVWHRQPSAARDHEPAKSRAAMAALFAAIEPVAGQPLALPDAQALKALVPTCDRLPTHEGLPIMEDLAEQLTLLDQQLLRQTAVDGVHNAPLRKRYQLNLTRWSEGIASGKVDCRHAAQALRTLAGPRGEALLQQSRWQEHQRQTAAASAPSAPAVQLAARSLSQGDPWRGWPGCIWLGGQASGSPAYYVSPAGRATWGKLLCEQEGIRPAGASRVEAAQPAAPGVMPLQGNPSWSIPKDLGSLLAELDGLRLPAGPLYDNYAATLPDGGNRRIVGRNEVDVGFNIHLTIDPRTQAIAQQVAECYTGQLAACALAGIDPSKVGAAEGPGAGAMWERAGARVTGIAVIDVTTARIEALASAHTPCYAQENDGPFRDAGCLPHWTRPARRPDALLNHAVFTDHLPGSTVKPLMASVFFEDGGSDPAKLSVWLAKSSTLNFNDELFCLNRKGGGACDRPARVQQRAIDLGWNVDCTARPSFRCSHADILFGRRLSARLDAEAEPSIAGDDAPLQRRALTGRLLLRTEAVPGGNAHRLDALAAINPKAAATCSNGIEWRATYCDFSHYKPWVNEAMGQGQARSTALGVATMLARLTAAANGIESLRRPHLVAQITDAQGRPVATAATREAAADSPALARSEPVGTRPEAAKAVLAALARSSQRLGNNQGVGTSHLICRHVFGAACAAAGQRMAGKTGTPSFTLAESTHAQASSTCRKTPNENCLERPVKWYVAAYRSSSSPNAPYDKVIAVMSERNWYVPGKAAGGLSDRVHGPKDLNNISTEIGMRVMAAAWGKEP